MFPIDRSKTKRPDFYYSQEWEGFKAEAEAFYSLPEEERSQSRFEFVDLNNFIELKFALLEEFHGKCAYTEEPLDPKSCVIIRHRPANGAADLEGNSSRDHYWWLAYEWENLIPVRVECARAKGNYFPVVGKRAKPFTSLEEIRLIERPMIPDPSFPGNAGAFFYDEEGEAFLLDNSEFNPIALKLIGLNNREFIERRKATMISIANGFRRHEETNDLRSFIKKFYQIKSSHVDLKLNWLRGNLRQLTLKRSERVKKVWSSFIPRLDVSQYPVEELLEIGKLLDRAKQKAPDRKIKKPKRPVKSVAAEETPIQTIQLRKVEIKNFKCIEELTIDLPQSNTSEAPNGLMILGENGSGKSSVLQAIVLALEAPEKVLNHPFLIRKKVLRRGSHKGHVRLYLVDHEVPIEVSFSRQGNFRFNGPRAEFSFFLSAYGPHRILPRHSERNKAPKIADVISINNLWDPYEALVDAERWMLDLDKKAFDTFALTLKDLLNLPEDGLIHRKSEQLYFDIGGEKLSLDDLSAGYQSVIATATDIVASYPISGTDMRDATGIVMIDEIGAHLHPSWRMRIVDAYRRAFSKMQFLCTTHEPLCLRGTRSEEVLVLRRDGQTVKQIEDLPNLEEMRIDQILTSPIFGMNTTVDPEAERKFQEYYYLLAKTGLTNKEKETREKLRKYLYRYGVLGASRRARAIYDIIDKDLSTKKPDLEGIKISQKTRNKVIEIWDNTSFEFSE